MSGFLNPQRVINELSLKEGMSVADFGCGSGGFSLPLAKEIKKGRIYAVDIMREPLSALKNRAKMEKVYNIRTIESDIEKKIDLRQSIVDLVVIANVLFQLENRENAIKEAYRVLRSNGQLLVVDWLPETKEGPEERVSKEELDNEIKKNGFVFEKEIDAGNYHFAYVYKKK